MAEKVWLASYPPGVPGNVDLNQYNSIRDIFENSIQKFGDKTAFSHLGTALSYQELDTLTRDFGAYLQSLPGMKKGDRVAFMLPNILQYPVAMLAAIRAGFVVVNLSPLYNCTDVQYHLRDSGAKAIVVCENVAHVLEKAINHTPVEHVVLASASEMHGFFKRVMLDVVLRHVKKKFPPFHIPGAVSFRKALALGRKNDLRKVTLARDDLAFLQYTSGSTGAPKGVMLTHGNMVANLQQVSAWVSGHVNEGSEIAIAALPLGHVFCLTANVLMLIKLGGHCLLLTDLQDMTRFVKSLSGIPFTVLTGDHVIFKALLNTDRFDQVDFSHVKLVLGAGLGLEPALAQRWKETTGTFLCQAYGLTEAAPAVCINPLNTQYTGSVGLPISLTDVSIRDGNFNELPLGRAGELCVKGPQVMRGYWNKPRDTAQALSQDGWLKTGDIAHMDEQGYCYITDRKKDTVLGQQP